MKNLSFRLINNFNCEPVKFPKKFRIAVNETCNYRCPYCREGGDGIYEATKNKLLLTNHEIVEICKIFENLGCKSVNLTGGEPSLRKDLEIILNSILRETSLNITLNTNGTRSIYFGDLSPLDVNRINVAISLDSLDEYKSEKYGRKNAPRKVTDFLQNCKKYNIKTRINTVIVKGLNDSHSEIIKLLGFSQHFNTNIKFQSVFDLDIAQFKSYQSLYAPMDTVVNSLDLLGYRLVSYKNADSGVPESVFSNNHHDAIVLDKLHQLTMYAPVCKDCKYFPCDTGMFSSYISSKGKLALCRMLNKEIYDFRENLSMPTEFATKKLKWMYETKINLKNAKWI